MFSSDFFHECVCFFFDSHFRWSVEPGSATAVAATAYAFGWESINERTIHNFAYSLLWDTCAPVGYLIHLTGFFVKCLIFYICFVFRIDSVKSVRQLQHITCNKLFFFCCWFFCFFQTGEKSNFILFVDWFVSERHINWEWDFQSKSIRTNQFSGS